MLMHALYDSMKKIYRLYIALCLMLFTMAASAQTFTLQGRVSDKDGHPIELASVSVLSQGNSS